MPRFLIPLLLLAVISLASFGFVVLRLGPRQTSSVILFLLTFFLSLTSTLSLAFFFIHKKFFFKPKIFAALGPVVIEEDLRPLFRISLRNAFLVSVVVIILAVVKVLGKGG